MGAIATIQDGKVVESTTTESTKSSNSTTLDKDAFLQLLVAQMKYQDPLEPTSNTEYISQFATFSELEEMQNMSATMELSRASALVGQEVVIKEESATGVTTYIRGQVDYVQIEAGKALLSVNGSLYSLDDVDTVADETYLEAYDKSNEFSTLMASLPTIGMTSLGDEEEIVAIRTMYDGMTSYQKAFIADTSIKSLEAYEAKLADLKAGE